MVEWDDDIVVWGMNKKIAWLIALLGGWPITFFWYREYNQEKYRRALAAEDEEDESG